MNESKCKHCEEPMIWKGDMLTGGLECCNEYCAASTGEVYVDHAEGSDETVYPTPVDPGQVYKDIASSVADNRNMKAYFNGQIPSIPDLEPEEPEHCTDYLNDRLNFDARRSGRTTRMLYEAVTCGRPCVVVANLFPMVKYMGDILKDIGCAPHGTHRNEFIVVGTGFIIKVTCARELEEQLRGRHKSFRVLFDHEVPRKYASTAWEMGFSVGGEA